MISTLSGQAICTIGLVSGSGACTLPPTAVPAGATQLVAEYISSTDFSPSSSAPQTLTVAKATTTTVLSLSAATVTHGQEQAEHLTVSVVPQYGGTPDGTVTIKSGTTKVCTITLSSGGGSCTLRKTGTTPARRCPALAAAKIVMDGLAGAGRPCGA